MVAALLCSIAVLGTSQEPVQNSNAPAASQPAAALYLKLGSVGLDQTQVYKIREASLDRAKIHISLDDGTIAFTQAVDGHLTGAFFQGYGEVLLMPPNQEERATLSMFTGAAILEETFSSAYLRFNDDVLNELKPYLRPAPDPVGFASEYDMTARNLAAEDALRLFLTFGETSPGIPAATADNDHMLRAYLEGNQLGAFDVSYDSLMREQIEAGQHKHLNGEDYYDLWCSFAVPAIGSSQSSARSEPDEAPPADLDVTSFKIRATVKPVHELDAVATLSVTARQHTRRTLLFQLSRMLGVTAVRADGHPVEFIHNQAIEGSHLAKQGDDVIAVVLPAPMQKNQKMELSFEYSGSVLSEAANGLLYVGDRGTWYPNVGFAMASFDLEFHYPVGWTLVATGARTDLKINNGEQISKWATARMVPVAGFNLGKYTNTTTHAGRVLVSTYATGTVERGFPGTAALAASTAPVLPDPGRFGPGRVSPIVVPSPPPPPIPSSHAQAVGEIAARAIEFYDRYFGPYPYDQLTITQMPGGVSQGWPGLIFLSSYQFLTPEETSRLQPDPVRRLMEAQVIAHEAAHQWWGDLVNWRSYRDQWIMEGLANYSALMLLESHDPVGFRLVMQAYRNDLMAKTEKGQPLMDAGPVTLGFRLSSSEFPGTYQPICYGRGTWLFHMLRTMMRDAQLKSGSAVSSEPLQDEPFIHALRKLRRDYADKAVSTGELMRVFESELPPSLWYEGHRSLEWFLDGWINGSAIPSFDLRGVKFSDRGRATLVTGTLVQQDAPDTLVTAVPLYTTLAGRSMFLKRVFAEGRETQFSFSAPLGTRKLFIDPDHTLLSRAK
jgi:Peptidase family M1 domain